MPDPHQESSGPDRACTDRKDQFRQVKLSSLEQAALPSPLIAQASEAPGGYATGENREMLRWTDALRIPLCVREVSSDERVRRVAELNGTFKAAYATGQPLHPRSIEDAVSRAMVVRRAFETGILAEEVERIGVSATWLEQYHARQPIVALSEQLIYLPTLFAKLDKYGNPAALTRALQDMEALGSRFSAALGREVEIGYLTSGDHVVTKRSITSGFYVLCAEDGSETVVRRRLLSSRELDQWDGVGYRDLEIQPEKVREILKGFDEDVRKLVKSAQSAAARAKKQAEFNVRSLERGDLISQEMSAREQAFAGEAKTLGEKLEAMRILQTDWKSALEETPLKESGKFSYCALLENLNGLFASRILGEGKFKTFYSEHLNSLVTFGIKDWAKFLSGLFYSGVLDPEEPILRLRVTPAGDHPFYKMLRVHSIKDGEVLLQNRDGKEIFPVRDLVEQSQVSVAGGHGPTIFPIASMRYWATYGIGNSIILDDGIPYAKLQRLNAALRSEHLTLIPRSLTIMPYTRLHTYQPPNPKEPYDQLKERFAAHQYLAFLSRAAALGCLKC